MALDGGGEAGGRVQDDADEHVGKDEGHRDDVRDEVEARKEGVPRVEHRVHDRVPVQHLHRPQVPWAGRGGPGLTLPDEGRAVECLSRRKQHLHSVGREALGFCGVVGPLWPRVAAVAMPQLSTLLRVPVLAHEQLDECDGRLAVRVEEADAHVVRTLSCA